MERPIGFLGKEIEYNLNDTQQPAVTLQLPATTTLDETFTEELRDPMSEKFKEDEKSFCDQVKNPLKYQKNKPTGI